MLNIIEIESLSKFERLELISNLKALLRPISSKEKRIRATQKRIELTMYKPI